MIDHTRPPPKRPGYRWEFREGCRCKSCPWKGNCRGEEWPHWIEVKEMPMTDEDLRRLAKDASDRYRALPASQRLRHDYMQRKSFARGMCPDSQDYELYCRKLDDRMPDPEALTDAQIGLLLNNSPWHL